jgi:integrase
LAGRHGRNGEARQRSNEGSLRTALDSRYFDLLRKKKLVDTFSEDFLRVLGCGRPSIHHYIRRLHNLALGLGWLPFPILAAKLWPKPQFKQKRAITLKEHKHILGAEMNAERNLFYQLLWEIGAAQSDAAALQADQIDWSARTLSFQRKKTGAWCHMVFGKALGNFETIAERRATFSENLTDELLILFY